MSSPRCTAAFALVLLAAAPVLAAPQLGDTRSDSFFCGQTSHFSVDMPDGTSIPFSVSSSFTLDTTMEYAGVRGKDRPKSDVYVWKIKNRSTMGGVANNPLYEEGGTGGQNPLFEASSIWVSPINDPPLADKNLELLIEIPGSGEPEGDSWSNTRVRVGFLDAKGNLLASYISDGAIDLLGDQSGSALEPGSQYFNHPRGPYPRRAMIAEAPGRNGTAPALYLESITFSTELIPTPGVAGLLGLGALAASRRRR